jgi:protein-tyrosine phosphatase
MRKAWFAVWASLVWVGACVHAAEALQPASAAGQPIAARSLGLDGAPNFRDIGGYASSDGRHVRWGRVFRSSELSKLTAEDQRKVAGLGLVAVIDLRTQEERDRSPSAWLERPADAYESPKPSLTPVMSTILRDAGTPDGARTGIEAFYAQMPDAYRDEYAAFFHRIAAGEVPILIHCSAGKDRTGLAIALLLATLRVPRGTIMADYALTETLVPALPRQAPGARQIAAAGQAANVLGQLPEASQRVLWRSDPRYLAAALRSIDREYGSVEGYVRNGLHLSEQEEAALRKALLD